MVFRFLNTEVNSDDGLLPSVKFYHLDEITNENKQELRIWCTEANTGRLRPFMYLLVLTCFGLWYKRGYVTGKYSVWFPVCQRDSSGLSSEACNLIFVCNLIGKVVCNVYTL